MSRPCLDSYNTNAEDKLWKDALARFSIRDAGEVIRRPAQQAIVSLNQTNS
jgi:hypothetical protein